MSVDKIGNVDSILSNNYSQAQRKVQKPAVNNTVDVIEKGPAQTDATKINYPPFFPVGDTQSIYKK